MIVKRLLPLCLIIVFCLAACAGSEPRMEKTAQELVQEGVAFFDNGKYQKSIKAFETLKDWYPFSKYAILAELKIPDAYFNLDSYAEAILAYDEFERLHPRNEATPYVIYRIGRSYFKQIDTIDRDQSNAAKALETYRRLVRQYPANRYADMARSDMQSCFKSIAGHEFGVAMFYYKSKNYKAALKRFTAIVETFPDMGYHQRALVYLANCEAWIQAQLQPPKPNGG